MWLFQFGGYMTKRYEICFRKWHAWNDGIQWKTSGI